VPGRIAAGGLLGLGLVIDALTSDDD